MKRYSCRLDCINNLMYEDVNGMFVISGDALEAENLIRNIRKIIDLHTPGDNSIQNIIGLLHDSTIGCV